MSRNGLLQKFESAMRCLELAAVLAIGISATWKVTLDNYRRELFNQIGRATISTEEHPACVVAQASPSSNS